jgi:hypothetical protein
MEIRSFRRVFELERRIYRVDRLRLNPSGVPVRGLAYFAAIALGCVVAARIPLVGFVFALPPWYLRDLALPALAAAVLAMVRIDGRPGHLAALAIGRYCFAPRFFVGGRFRARCCQRWSPGDVVLLPDGADGGVPHMRYRGPGAAVIAIEHERVLAVRGAVSVAFAVGRNPRRSRSRRVVLLPRRGRLELGQRQPTRSP